MTGIGQFVSLESIIELVSREVSTVQLERGHDDEENKADRWYVGGIHVGEQILAKLKAMRTCSCLSELELDAYSSGGPMSGKPRPAPCMVHPDQDGKRQTIFPTYPRGPIKD